ncbi:MAG: YraN family protein [bacterium]|nr:YraN family protein [bacterium]
MNITKDQFMLSKKQIGNIGEDTTVNFLKKRGYDVCARNYAKKCGEIDIVAKKDNALHFVEVKSTLCEKLPEKSSDNAFYMPEERVTSRKLSRLRKTVGVFLRNNKISEESEWYFHVSAVYLKLPERIGRVFFIEHQVL